MLEVKKDGSINDVSLINILDASTTEETLAESINGELSFGINEEQYSTENVLVSRESNVSYFNNVRPLQELPTKPKPLNEYTNSIDENFFGEQTTVTKLRSVKSGQEKLISRHKTKLGPIMIKMKNGHLMEDWEEGTTEKIDDYRIEKSKALES